MKVVSKDEDDAHYSTVLKGGFVGGTIGLGAGVIAVLAASRRYPAVRSLTLPFRAFMVTSAATFGAITSADRASHTFKKAQDPMNFYKDEASRDLEQAKAKESQGTKLMGWARENRYTIVVASWVASMAIAGILVGRNRYLTTSQKVVQARVYAQGLTLAVLVASAALETSDARSGTGRYESVMVLDPDDPEHKHMIEKKIHKEEYSGQDLWQDMIASEERRLKEQHKDVHLRKKAEQEEKANTSSDEPDVRDNKQEKAGDQAATKAATKAAKDGKPTVSDKSNA